MKPCPNFPGYSATADGRIFSHRRHARVPGMRRGGTIGIITREPRREMRQRITPKGYRYVGIRFECRQRPIGVHQLVADAHLGPRPSPEHQVRHLDGNPANNNASNLAWGTALENAADRLRHGHYERGGRHQNAKLNEEQVRGLLARRERGEKVASIAASLRVGVSTVEDILYGKTWRHVTDTFKRIEVANG